MVGKFIWHQVNVVVILKKNMRQQATGTEEKAFHTALENMRYAACTTKDLRFLRSKIVHTDSDLLLKDANFRNVSIITAQNKYKDMFNVIGSKRFAADHGLDLHDFYSVDELLSAPEPGAKKRKYRRKTSSKLMMTEPLQRQIWNITPSSTAHVAGKLSLCLGMPVMICHNDATELCITKGQEGLVAGWDSSTGPYGQNILETLYVQLINPPKNVKFEGLADNIVPIPKSKEKIYCMYKDDHQIRIEREQV
ncbi:hypothetical protein FA13DRAFT_1639025, partial [Coprinellus micaceus]